MNNFILKTKTISSSLTWLTYSALLLQGILTVGCYRGDAASSGIESTATTGETATGMDTESSSSTDSNHSGTGSESGGSQSGSSSSSPTSDTMTVTGDTTGLDGSEGLGQCGDGVIDPGEECDDGGESAQCNDDCSYASCGDSKLNKSSGETCDDGNKEGGADDCSNKCEINPRLVFVTSETYNGKLGGLKGADLKCQTLAESGGLPGEYRAWLSADGQSPTTRFANVNINASNVPYQNVNGVEVATSWEGLLTTGIVGKYGIHRGEQIGDITDYTGKSVWTNTKEDGTEDKTYTSCNNWSSDSQNQPFGGNGEAGETDYRWTRNGSSACHVTKHLYCFKQAPKQ